MSGSRNRWDRGDEHLEAEGNHPRFKIRSQNKPFILLPTPTGSRRLSTNAREPLLATLLKSGGWFCLRRDCFERKSEPDQSLMSDE